MIALTKPVRRLTRGALDAHHGSDRDRRLVASLEPGDLLVLKPYKTRRAEIISLFDVYTFAVKSRVMKTHMEKLRARKGELADRRRESYWKRSIRRGKL